MSGPNAPATFSVPRFWTEKSAIAISPAMTIRTFVGVCFQPGDQQQALDGATGC